MQETNLVINLNSLKKVIDQVSKAVPKKAGRHRISAVKFESNGTRLRAVASDGFRIAISEAPLSTLTFPQYEKALAKFSEFKTELRFSAHALRSALFQLKPAIDRRNPKLTFRTVGRSVEVSAGDAKAVLACKKTGKNNKVALNPDFVSDFLSKVPPDAPWHSDEVTMQIIHQIKGPVRLSNGPDYVHFVMPLLPETRRVERVP
jgi:DNA polymerase III sliding clamp (beta) subunit (PCNA family)